MLSPGRSIVYSKIESAGKLDKTEEVRLLRSLNIGILVLDTGEMAEQGAVE
jgi:hypothetical protein